MQRISIDDVNNNEYFKLYKFLFSDKYIKLSNDAKVLYSILRDRLLLSIKNNWINEKGQVYLIYTVKDLESILNCGNKKAIKCKKELTEFGLLEEEKLGLNRPNLLFLTAETTINTGRVKTTLPDVSKQHFKKCQNDTSGDVNITLQEVSKRHSNKTEYNKTDYNNTIQYKNDDVIALPRVEVNYLIDLEVNSEFEEFLRTRSNKLSETEIKRNLSFLKKYEDDPEEQLNIILRSKINGWRELYEIPNEDRWIYGFSKKVIEENDMLIDDQVKRNLITLEEAEKEKLRFRRGGVDG